jgi:hypothetical protein
MPMQDAGFMAALKSELGAAVRDLRAMMRRLGASAGPEAQEVRTLPVQRCGMLPHVAPIRQS